MSTSSNGRAHDALRRATAEGHHALDHHPLLQRLTGRGLTREQYAESLAAMYRPHVLLEQAVHASSHHHESGLGLRARVAWLEADLLELGLSVEPVEQLPPEHRQSRAAWWGQVYVLEGSRRGGAVIARCVLASLGDSVPRRFFCGDGLPGGDDRLPALLERELEGPSDLEQAVASARAAFTSYRHALDAFEAAAATA